MHSRLPRGGKLVVSASRVHGRGLFARAAIVKSEVVCTIRGTRVDQAELAERDPTGAPRVGVPFQIGIGSYFLLAEPYSLLNHSCAPNIGVRGLATVFALRDIAVGEELLLDYSTVRWDEPRGAATAASDGLARFACACGSPGCRSQSGAFYELPETLQTHYAELGALPGFVLAQLRKVKPR